MRFPSCRDALSFEISQPVHDPLTGRCYRNPCAAEQAGVPDWVHGCTMFAPVYLPESDGGWMDTATWFVSPWGNGHGPRPGDWTPGRSRPRLIPRQPGGPVGMFRPRFVPREAPGPRGTYSSGLRPRPAPGPRSTYSPGFTPRPARGPLTLATAPTYGRMSLAPGGRTITPRTTYTRTSMVAASPGVVASPRMRVVASPVAMPAGRPAGMKGLGQEGAAEGVPYTRILALLALGAVLFHLNQRAT